MKPDGDRYVLAILAAEIVEAQIRNGWGVFADDRAQFVKTWREAQEVIADIQATAQ